MPILGALVLVIQLCFAYHALKSGRPYWWLFVIVAFPAVGCVLYYFIEVFPSSRARVADVEACGSVENRMLLARQCMEERMYAEAAALYRSCLVGGHETDPEIRYGYASALVLDGKHEEALAVAQRLRASHPAFRSADVALVIARALEGAHRLDEALKEFGVLADTYPGEEGRWRYGALLARLGRTHDAQEVFRRMLRNAQRLPAQYRSAQKSWLDLARQSMQA